MSSPEEVLKLQFLAAELSLDFTRLHKSTYDNNMEADRRVRARKQDDLTQLSHIFDLKCSLDHD